MHLEALENLDREGLMEFVKGLLWQYRVMDAFWFINIENRQGLAEAEKTNELVWGKVGELSAKDIVKRFGPFGKGIDGFLDAYRYFPWYMLVDFKFERDGDDLIITVAECPPQMARLSRDMGEYDCKDMHRAEFQGFAKVVDPAIEVICEFAPPDEHPADCFCQWRFTVGK